jgi:hypothetical protein
MHYNTLCIATFAGLAVAMPAAPAKAASGKVVMSSKAVTKGDPKKLFSRIIDPWEEIGPKSHSKRDTAFFDESSFNSSTVNIAREEFSTSDLLEHAKRGLYQYNVKNFPGAISGCAAEDDPSNKDTIYPIHENGQIYAVNEGVKLPKSGKNDQCTHARGIKSVGQCTISSKPR